MRGPGPLETGDLSAAGNSGVPAGRGEQEEEEVEGKCGQVGVIGDRGVPRGAQVQESSLRRVEGRGQRWQREREREREKEKEKQTGSRIKKAVRSSDAAATNCDYYYCFCCDYFFLKGLSHGLKLLSAFLSGLFLLSQPLKRQQTTFPLLHSLLCLYNC